MLLPVAPLATAVLYAGSFVEPVKDALGWNPLVLVLLGWWAVALTPTAVGGRPRRDG